MSLPKIKKKPFIYTKPMFFTTKIIKNTFNSINLRNFA